MILAYYINKPSSYLLLAQGLLCPVTSAAARCLRKRQSCFPQCTGPIPVAPPDHRKVFHESCRHRVHHPLRHVRHAHDSGPGLVLRRARPVKKHPLHVHAQLCRAGDGLHPLGPVRLLPCFQRRYLRPYRQP